MKIFGLRKRFYVPPIVVIILSYLAAFTCPEVKLVHVYKILPAFVVYSDFSVPKIAGGVRRGPYVLIRPESKNSYALEQHELIHVEQGYRSFFTNWVGHFLSGRHRANLEAEAYAVQAYHEGIRNPEDLMFYAGVIHKYYYTGLTKEQIYHILLSYWPPKIWEE